MQVEKIPQEEFPTDSVASQALYRFSKMSVPIIDNLSFLEKRGALLGRGSCGEVYSFEYEGQECAVKIFGIKAKDFMPDILDEMRIAKEFGKLGLAPVVYRQGIITDIPGYEIQETYDEEEEEYEDDKYDVHVCKKQKTDNNHTLVPFMLMEKYESSLHTQKFFAVDLKKRMEALLIAAEKIEAMHKIGFAHNDIKASNILINFTKDTDMRAEKVCITDFDCTHYLGIGYGECAKGACYSSPEVFFGENKMKLSSAKNDSYQFVLVVWFSLFRKYCVSNMEPRTCKPTAPLLRPSVFDSYVGYGKLEHDIRNGNIRKYVAYKVGSFYRKKGKIVDTFTEMFCKNLQADPEKRNTMSEIAEHIRTLCGVLE
jgi:serine/threonine protein kinase